MTAFFTNGKKTEIKKQLVKNKDNLRFTEHYRIFKVEKQNESSSRDRSFTTKSGD